MIRDEILNALKEKGIFIGYYQLCRYLNGKGYIRYGCNAGYLPGKVSGKDRLNPCKILCPNSKIYRSKVVYWCKKLELEKLLLLEKKLLPDSQNPNSNTKKHKTNDIFIVITLRGVKNGS